MFKEAEDELKQFDNFEKFEYFYQFYNETYSNRKGKLY